MTCWCTLGRYSAAKPKSIILQDFLVENKIPGSINYSRLSRSWSINIVPDHHTSTAMFECGCSSLFLKCLRDDFVDLSGLKRVIHFIYSLFLNFFRSGSGVLTYFVLLAKQFLDLAIARPACFLWNFGLSKLARHDFFFGKGGIVSDNFFTSTIKIVIFKLLFKLTQMP